LASEQFSFYPQFIAEFDLRSVQYEVKSSRCHEMRLAAPPHDCIRFNFRCDREAEEWATVVMSSLREAHRGQFVDFVFCPAYAFFIQNQNRKET